MITYDWLLLGIDARVIMLNSVRQNDNSGVVAAPDLFVTIGARL